MELVISENTPTVVSFKIGVLGTSMKPSVVKVILEKDGRSVGFRAAQEVSHDDVWSTTIDPLSSHFDAGLVEMSIHVLLNDRLFVPFRREIVLAGSEAPTVAPMQEPAPVEVPQQDSTMAPVAPPVINPMVVPEAKKASVLIKDIEASITEKVQEVKRPAQRKISKADVKPLCEKRVETKKAASVPSLSELVPPPKKIFQEEIDAPKKVRAVKESMPVFRLAKKKIVEK